MLNCNLHDYVEIVCLYRYPLCLTLVSGEQVYGTALDTRYNSARQECLVLSHAGTEQWVGLDDITLLEVTVPNPHVQQIRFK
ncbi:transcriptional regulator [Arsukibacterium ikkense]|uniref:Transcriptional regulator n=1 Tax=Arsukibacterium ikkense TaxID=336831 RepID=A0A0M2V2K1_9GAMM|nr:Rho-binding antiterminator [Arsukibacterium ikkense]KKO44846.1 transcriptional regulator [Arsukibacterium ikkense]